MSNATTERSLALYVLCLSVLMVSFDGNVVTIAVVSIAKDLHSPNSSIIWMLNSYLLPFGGFLIVCGRLGDLYGPRRVFLAGISVFTVGSLLGGIAHIETLFFCARIIQGLGGAAVTAVSLSLITNIFSNSGERARALGFYGFVSAAGAGVGELIGGVVTQSLGWHWIFLINLPVGVASFLLCARRLPRDTPSQRPRDVDFLGAVVITSALTLLAYTLGSSEDSGSPWTGMVGLYALIGLLFALFVLIERRARAPIMPLQLFRQRNFTAALLLALSWVVGLSAWFALSTFYLQYVLGYDPLHVGLAFIPTDFMIGMFSIGLSQQISKRFGVRRTLCTGLLLVAACLALFTRAPVNGQFVFDVLPGMVLMGLGSGMASTALLLAATDDVDTANSGVASGVLNTSFLLGGGLGLAVLSAIARAYTQELQRAGTQQLVALNEGYHYAFAVAAALAAVGALLSAVVLRSRARSIPAPSPSISGQG